MSPDQIIGGLRALISTQAVDQWTQARAIWASGGWAMWAIAAIALLMFTVGVNVQLRLKGTGFLSVREKTWRRWLNNPQEGRGPIGELISSVTETMSLDDTRIEFRRLKATETVPFERDLKVMRVCVSAAPLVGLLGTVTGMLSTFGALSSGTTGDKTMESIAAGISEALITTETGLVIALPGLFFQYQLGAQFARYRAFLAQVESAYMQILFRRQEPRAEVQDQAPVNLVGAVSA